MSFTASSPDASSVPTLVSAFNGEQIGALTPGARRGPIAPTIGPRWSCAALRTVRPTGDRSGRSRPWSGGNRLSLALDVADRVAGGGGLDVRAAFLRCVVPWVEEEVDARSQRPADQRRDDEQPDLAERGAPD